MRRHPRSYDHFTDGELIRNFREKEDAGSLGALYKRHFHKVYGLSLNYLKSPVEAEDAVMEIFELVIEGLKKHEVTHFESWLFQVSRNYLLKRLKQLWQGHQEELSELNPALFMENQDPSTLIFEQWLEALSEGIDQLREGQRECIVMFYLENRSYKEIEASTSYSLNEIKSHIQNGKRNLKNYLLKLT